MVAFLSKRDILQKERPNGEMNRLPLLLPIRSIVFVLVFVIGALAAHKHVDEISNWWSIIAVVVNIMNILLLVYAARRNGKTYWELIN